MCGRYNIIPDAEAWSEAFDLTAESVEAVGRLATNYNVCPSTQVPIVRLSQTPNACVLGLVHWGLIPFWAKQKSIGNKMINARSETLAVKPAFRHSYRNRRCIVPASGFYEWKKTAGQGAKQPYLIRLHDREVFGFAGLWERWKDPADGQVLESCSIITTDANERMAEVHDRMPVILDRADHANWLDLKYPEPDSLLKPCPAEWLELIPVSTRVNNPRNNDAQCIAPLSGMESRA